MMKQTVRVVFLLMALALLNGCVQTEQGPEPVDGTITLTFLTIGKGDAFLLTAPGGEHYLIDTGKKEDYPQIARFLRIKGIDTLDGIFLSHGHLDHAGSLEPLLDAFTVKKIYISAIDTVSYHEVDPEALGKTYQVPVERITRGDILSQGGMTIRCWIPDQICADNENDNSVILRITYGETAFLLMGDAELDEEAALLGSDEVIQANVLKLGHHGENDATSQALLEKVKPQYALITGNETENPDSENPDVAARVQAVGAKAIYSECDGLGIDFRSDGKQILVETVADPELPPEVSLSLQELDRKNQRIVIKNTGTVDADLSGCTLFSQRGSKIFRFPNQVILAPGNLITVSCRGNWREGDLLWDEDSVWKKKNDAACLYDSHFTLLDELTD